jgi:subtilisin family serine protease
LGENTDVSPHFPSGWAQYLPNVISVGGIDGFGQVAEMSNFGAMSVTCFASWGATMLSLDGSIAGGAGTSIACASISGVAAVLAAKNPGMTAWQLREQITRTAARKGFLEGKCQTGAMLDALAAVSTQPTLDSIDVLETKGKVKYASATSIVTIKIASTDPGAVITVLGYEAVIKIKPSFQKIKLTNVKIRPAGSDLWFTVISSKGGVLYIMGDGSSSQRWPAT